MNMMEAFLDGASLITIAKTVLAFAPMILPAAAGAPNGYTISRSLRLRSSSPGYLSRTPSASNRTTWTWSGWVKRSNIGAIGRIFGVFGGSTDTDFFSFNFNNDAMQINGGTTTWRITTALFRDPSAWYHIVLAFDTNQGTANNRIRVYVNGVEQTSFSTLANPSSAATLAINSAAAHNIGISTNVFDGYLADVCFVDGQQLTPSSFGAFDAATGVWNPISYTGTYGTNGFKLNFSDNSAATAAAIGADSSGNGNNWTPSGISITAGVTNDSMVDTPTNYGTDSGSTSDNARGNYGILNPLDKAGVPVITEGNTKLTTATVGWNSSRSTIWVPSSGNYYFEATVVNITNGVIVGTSAAPNCDTYPGHGTTAADPSAVGYANTGNKFVNAGAGAAYGSTFTTNDVIGCQISAGSVFFYKNGVVQNSGTAALTGLTGDVTAHIGCFNSGADTLVLNCGQRPWANTPPSGAKGFCTQNLPTPAIVKPSQYFNAVTWTANGGVQSITGVGHQPDFYWAKNRGVVSSHFLVDSVRGVSKTLDSSATTAEGTSATYVTSFDTDGFTMGTGNYPNTNTIVTWSWKKGVTPGFDIVTYTTSGATPVSHSLGVKPAMIISKDRSTASTNWAVTHKSLGTNMQDNIVLLNLTNANSVSAGQWGGEPTSNQFYNGTGLTPTGRSSIAYLFAEVAGFSKFGSYTGNGAADGPFVYCGFRPRWLVVKRTDTTSNWEMHDSARSPVNVINEALWSNLTNAEAGSGGIIDFTTNGFKHRGTSTDMNAASGTYIYAAFAENPFKYARAR